MPGHIREPSPSGSASSTVPEANHPGAGESTDRWGRWSWLVPILLGALVAGAFSYHVAQYYFWADDAFISFRYARNLVDGHGLVFNPGELVEGYTNFLWVLMMAGAMGIGLSVELTSNVLGIVSGAAILALLAHFGARTSSWTDPWIWLAPLALALNRTFCAWSTSGMETQLFSLLTLAASLRFCVERERGVRTPWSSALLFGLATLTRPEGALFFAVAGLFFAVDWTLLRRRRFSSLLIWGAVFIAIVGAHVSWRYTYYGFLLPNTYYAKVSGLWIDQGLRYLGLFVADHRLLWSAPLLLLLTVQRPRFETLFFTTLGMAFVAYLLYVGGDHFEFRFLDPVLPYLFWLFQEAIRGSVARWSASGWRGPAVSSAGAVASALVLWCAYAPHTGVHVERRGIGPLERMKVYTERRAEEGRFLRSLVDDGYLRGDELIAVGGAGALPYYSRLPALDTHGLMDVEVAHQEISRRHRVGHEKEASFEHLTERGVVIYDIFNRIVLPQEASETNVDVRAPKSYPGLVHRVEAKGRYLVFGTTLQEEEFARVFSRFRILE